MSGIENTFLRKEQIIWVLKTDENEHLLAKTATTQQAVHILIDLYSSLKVG